MSDSTFMLGHVAARGANPAVLVRSPSGMKFVQYSPAEVRDCNIDWNASVDLTDAVRLALQPHDAETLRSGRLRRPFLLQPPTAGRRSRHVVVKHRSAEPVAHARGAIVFSYSDGSWFLIEA
jgi:hypothetical protein